MDHFQTWQGHPLPYHLERIRFCRFRLNFLTDLHIFQLRTLTITVSALMSTFFSDRLQMWQGHSLSWGLGGGPFCRFCLIWYANNWLFNELISLGLFVLSVSHQIWYTCRAKHDNQHKFRFTSLQKKTAKIYPFSNFAHWKLLLVFSRPQSFLIPFSNVIIIFIDLRSRTSFITEVPPHLICA